MEIRQIGIYVPKTMRPMKRIILIVCAVLTFCMAAGGSIAWLIFNPDPVNNQFTPGNVTITVDEDFKNNVKSDVKIKNIGNVPAYIRVALVPAWVDEEGNVVAQPASLEDCEITWGNIDPATIGAGEDWFLGSDGFYYCSTAIEPETSTPILIKQCTVKTDEGQTHKYDFELRILASAVQAIPTSAVSEAWNAVGVDATNGQLVWISSEGGN